MALDRSAQEQEYRDAVKYAFGRPDDPIRQQFEETMRNSAIPYGAGLGFAIQLVGGPRCAQGRLVNKKSGRDVIDDYLDAPPTQEPSDDPED